MPNADPLRIRMYNVGFGDAFLLYLPTDDGLRLMLVDCGVHQSGVKNKISSVVADIRSEAKEHRDGIIDVVVATHRHADHISGFDLVAFKRNVVASEVWLPWTEEADNPAAIALRTAQKRFAAQLKAALDSPATSFDRKSSFAFLALNALSNEGAMTTLTDGLGGPDVPRKYLPAMSRDERSFTTPVLPGVTVHAMGPSHDPAVIAEMDPPAGAYFPAASHLDERTPDSIKPFARSFDSDEMAEAHPHLVGGEGPAQIKELVESGLEGLAASITDAINGTSLVLGIEIGDTTVVMGGDAEWGTWREILADPEWVEILARTNIYKVSHHGSYNGTPRAFVDDHLPDDAVSLASLTDMAMWPSIPRQSLFDALDAKDRQLIRSDKAKKGPSVQIGPKRLWVEYTHRA